MERQDIFGVLRTDIGEEGVERQLEQQRKKLRRKKKKLAEQMRQDAEAAGLHEPHEATDQAGNQATASSKSSKATKTKPETSLKSSKIAESKTETPSKSSKISEAKQESPTKTSKIAESSMTAASKPGSAKSSVSPKSSASAKGSKTPTGGDQAKPEEPKAPEVDMFPEYSPEPPEQGKPEGGKEVKPEEEEEESRSMLYAALAVLGLLAMLVLAGLFLYTKPLEALTNGTILKVNPCSSPGCVKAKTLSDQMLYTSSAKKGTDLHPCDNFYRYSCGGWATTHFDTSAHTILNGGLLTMMNHTLSTVDQHAPSFGPYRNLIVYYRSCIEFHTTPMPTDVRVRKALYLLDFSFTEWLEHNTDPIFLFYFIIRLSLSQGVSTLLKLSVIEKNREARVVLEVGMSVREKFYTDTTRVYEERAWKLYMSDALFSIGIPNITAEVAMATLLWDMAQEKKWRQAQQDHIHEHSLSELISRESVVSGEDWLYAINDNMPYNLRLKNTSNMDTHNLTLIDDVVNEFFTKSKIELVTYVATLAIAELLRYDFNREHRYVATCLRSSYNNFPEPLMSLFVNEHIKEEVVKNFRIFFDNIKHEVLDAVSSFDWMDQNTRVKAAVKVKTVTLRTVKSTTREVNADEEKMSGDFMANYVAIARYNKKRANRYPEPSTKHQENLDLIIGNVKVDYEQNVISVPARDLLEPVFFEQVKEKFVNLSYLGSTLAAEMVSVAFAPSGSKYAAGGLQIDWWPERVNTSYDKRLRCYLSEYRQLSKDFLTSGNFSTDSTPPLEVLEYLMTYSRGLEISYNMADITDTSNKQLFFARFCQALCDSDANKNTHARESLNVRLACMYPLLHSDGFRDAFACQHVHTLYPKENCPRL
ncbi:hypothetical protein MRX96_036747 [Rhipicephalus microplus]